MKSVFEICLDVILEGKGNKRRHGSSSFSDMLKIATELGCEVDMRNGKYIIKPPIDRLKKLNLPSSSYQYISHAGEEGYHFQVLYRKDIFLFISSAIACARVMVL